MSQEDGCPCLTSSVPTGQFVCPGQRVNFTCEVRHATSPILHWNINGSRIQLHAERDQIPRPLGDYPGVIAGLKRERRVLMSELTISNFSYSSIIISCSAEDDRIRSDIITLHLLGML